MAVKPLFRTKFPLMVTGSLLALQPVAALAAGHEVFDCRPDTAGGWACTPQNAAAGTQPSLQVKPSAPAPAAQAPVQAQAAPVAAARPRSGTDYSRIDWVPRANLTAAQQAEIGSYCGGAYIEPSRQGIDEQKPLAEVPTFVSARASRYEDSKQLATLAGDVVLRQGSIQAEADEANLYQAESRGELSGNVRLRDNGFLVLGERAELHLENGAAQIDNAEYVIHEAHVRGSAQYVKRGEDAIVRLKDGTYTRCEPGNNAWELKGNNITLNQDTGFGSATNVTLRVKDVPVFYTPYIYFPIDDRRQSGLLPPSFNTSEESGLSVITPYYFNLAPHYDATLYPNLMSKRGLMLEGEGRYLTPDSSGKLGAAWLNDQENDRQHQPKYDKTRYLYNWQHTGGLGSRLLSEVDYTKISDPYYFQDLETQLDISNTSYVTQRGSLTWRGDTFNAQLAVHAYELASITDITPYDRLPQLRLEGALPFQPAGLRFDYATEYVRFDRDLDEYVYRGQNSPDARLQGLTRITGNRAHLEPGVSLPLSWDWGYATPSVKYLYTDYDLDLDNLGKSTLLPGTQFKKSQSRSVPVYSVDSGLYFDRDTAKGRQTLEPRLFYLNVPYRDQSDLPLFDSSEYAFNYAALFRDNRFSGKDRIGDSNQLSLGVSSRFLEDSGFERQRISVGQAYYFQDRRVQLPGITIKDQASTSPLAIDYLYRFDRNWRLNSDFNWDTDKGRTRSGSLMFHYQPQDNPDKIVNIGYRYRNDTRRFDPYKGVFVEDSDEYKIDQHDLSMIWPIVPQWNAIARWQYDYNQSRTLEAFGGFEYDSCCWKLRLVNRYWLDYDELNLTRRERGDRGIFLQIILKGLGGVVGNNVNSFLDKGIQGYREREQQAY